MLFNLTIGNKGSVAGDDFTMYVSINAGFRNEKHGVIAAGTFEYAVYDPARILKDINGLIV